jgi:hypothetical protein
VNAAARVRERGGLVDGGANGGMAGDDCLVLAFLHQYACAEGADGYGSGPTIHSTVQLESFGLEVQDNISHGKKYIKTPDGFEFELRTRNGLTYLK